MLETASIKRNYSGTVAKQLDPKRRIMLPAKWRFTGDDADSSYLAIYTSYGAITVLPPDMAANLREKTSKVSLSNANKRRALARFMSNTCTFGCDKQGRILLDESILAKANITKDVCLAGMGATFEIWDTQTRNEWLSDSDEEADNALLEELGI